MNLLILTSFYSNTGEGLRATVSRFMKDTRIENVEYCARVGLQRKITINGNDSYIAGKFGVISHHGYELRNDGGDC